MHTRPTQIALSTATTGMTLSDPVLDTKGNVLLPEGTVLTTSLIASLARHQIDSIAITTDAPSMVDAEAEQDRQIGRVEHLFRKAGRANAASGTLPAGDAAPMHATDILHRLVLNFRAGVSNQAGTGGAGK